MVLPQSNISYVFCRLSVLNSFYSLTPQQRIQPVIDEEQQKTLLENLFSLSEKVPVAYTRHLYYFNTTKYSLFDFAKTYKVLNYSTLLHSWTTKNAEIVFFFYKCHLNIFLFYESLKYLPSLSVTEIFREVFSSFYQSKKYFKFFISH